MDKTTKNPKDMTDEETAKKENKTVEILNLISPLAIASLGDVLKELDFVVNCDIEGDLQKDRFEPHVKLSFKIARSMESVLKVKEHDLEKLEVLSEIENEREALKMGKEFKMYEFAKEIDPFRGGVGGDTSNSDCGCGVKDE